jgi:enoyl-CoA hydratase/carnithine racemase
MGNDSLIRELAFTGRTLTGEEALKHGLVSRVLKDKESMVREMLIMAENISGKSPIAIYNLKKVMNAFKLPKMKKGLEYVALTNMSQLFTNDVGEAMTASLSKQKAKFSKL